VYKDFKIFVHLQNIFFSVQDTDDSESEISDGNELVLSGQIMDRYNTCYKL
jgi:hypothetical protein